MHLALGSENTRIKTGRTNGRRAPTLKLQRQRADRTLFDKN